MINLKPYRRVIRPAIATSFPMYVEQELDKVAVVTTALVDTIKDLQAQIDALKGAP